MQVSTVNKAHQTRSGEEEVWAPQSLEILDYIVVNNAKGEFCRMGTFSVRISMMYRNSEIRGNRRFSTGVF